MAGRRRGERPGAPATASRSTLVDVGVAGDLSAAPLDRRACRSCARACAPARGTSASRTRWIGADAEAALDAGARVAARRSARCDLGARSGEIGIGNTTAAAALVCALTRRGAARRGRAAGRGSTTRRVARKTRVVEDALARSAASRTLRTIRSASSRRSAASSSRRWPASRSECARRRIPVVLDGFLAAAAALVARAIDPGVVAVSPRVARLAPSAGTRIALAALGPRAAVRSRDAPRRRYRRAPGDGSGAHRGAHAAGDGHVRDRGPRRSTRHAARLR